MDVSVVLTTRRTRTTWDHYHDEVDGLAHQAMLMRMAATTTTMTMMMMTMTPSVVSFVDWVKHFDRLVLAISDSYWERYCYRYRLVALVVACHHD